MKISSPVKIILKQGASARLPELLQGRRHIVISSRGFRARQWDRHLPQPVCVIDTITTNPTYSEIMGHLKQLSPLSFDAIVAVGGGSVMDTGKICALLQNDDPHSLSDYLKGTKIVPSRRENMLICVPTTSGTGSEVTPFATVWDKTHPKKMSLTSSSLYPDWALIDPNLALSLSPNLTIASGLDTLSHLLESFWNRNATPYTRSLAIEGVRLSLGSFLKTLDSPADVALRENMARASLLGGICISQTQTAIAHSISYPLTAHLGIPHGIASGAFLRQIYHLCCEEGLTERIHEIDSKSASSENIDVGLTALFYVLHNEGIFRQIKENRKRIMDLVPEMLLSNRAGNHIVEMTEQAIRNILTSFPWV